MSEFSGFPRDFFRFFRQLAANNERPWFEANKARYRESVVAPAVEGAGVDPPLHLRRAGSALLAATSPR